MRVVLGILTVVTGASLGLLFWLSYSEFESLDFAKAAPPDVVALVSVPNIQDLELLRELRLHEVMGESVAEFSSVEALPLLGALSQLRERVVGLALILHRLEKRETGAYKLHWTLVLHREHSDSAKLKEELKGLATHILGGIQNVHVQAGRTTWEGNTEGRKLFLADSEPVLVVSNGNDLLGAVLESLEDDTPSLLQTPALAHIRSQLGDRSGVFVYLNGKRAFDILPVVGYQMWRDGKEVREMVAVAAEGNPTD
jgi:hypothetical protein